MRLKNVASALLLVLAGSPFVSAQADCPDPITLYEEAIVLADSLSYQSLQTSIYNDAVKGIAAKGDTARANQILVKSFEIVRSYGDEQFSNPGYDHVSKFLEYADLFDLTENEDSFGLAFDMAMDSASNPPPLDTTQGSISWALDAAEDWTAIGKAFKYYDKDHGVGFVLGQVRDWMAEYPITSRPIYALRFGWLNVELSRAYLELDSRERAKESFDTAVLFVTNLVPGELYMDPRSRLYSDLSGMALELDYYDSALAFAKRSDFYFDFYNLAMHDYKNGDLNRARFRAADLMNFLTRVDTESSRPLSFYGYQKAMTAGMYARLGATESAQDLITNIIETYHRKLGHLSEAGADMGPNAFLDNLRIESEMDLAWLMDAYVFTNQCEEALKVIELIQDPYNKAWAKTLLAKAVLEQTGVFLEP